MKNKISNNFQNHENILQNSNVCIQKMNEFTCSENRLSNYVSGNFFYVFFNNVLALLFLLLLMSVIIVIDIFNMVYFYSIGKYPKFSPNLTFGLYALGIQSYKQGQKVEAYTLLPHNFTLFAKHGFPQLN